LDLRSDDRILYTSAIVFDVTTFEIWGALLNGMTLFVAEKETILDAVALGKELSKNKITILHLTSALLTHLAQARTDIFAGLRFLLVGGDVLSAHHINKVRNDNPKLQVMNCYGPSENTTYSTTYLIDKTFDLNIPIGKPVSNSTIYIFDKQMNYQPIGVIGELYVGGDGLSKGYLNRDDLNKTSFIDHPFIPGERLYRTGDFGRWLPDGNIEFHGRVDNQLKIRGFRVELGEIESVISEINGIIETVIKPFKIQEGDIRLAAFLNVSDTFSMDTIELSRRIKEKLPSYMIPSFFKLMNGFPKTINGKTDKDSLVLDNNELVIKERKDLITFTPTEEIIYEIWREALKTQDISVTDNFFEIGGNSLLALSVFSKIELAFNIVLALRIFFDSPRIKDLAEAIDITIYKMDGSISNNKDKIDSNIIIGEI
jgi:acyl-coenzyme A synthetase/AMP-(fatty) acid ligase/acyl carrier protein